MHFSHLAIDVWECQLIGIQKLVYFPNEVPLPNKKWTFSDANEFSLKNRHP